MHGCNGIHIHKRHALTRRGLKGQFVSPSRNFCENGKLMQPVCSLSYTPIAFIGPHQYQFHFVMEKQYNCLLPTSKIVGSFYENVYSPVLQALPWLV